MAASELNISTQVITPQMAKDWLQQNTHNRKVSKNLVRAFARDMRADKWQYNGDAIRFNCDGALIDGQHRLMAVIEANTKIKSLVISNLPKITQETIDSGRKRTPADVLQLRGYKFAAMLAASGTRLIEIKEGGRGDHKRTNAEVADFVEAHPKLPLAIERTYASYPVYASVLGAVYYITNTMIRGAKDKSESFIDVLLLGDSAYEGDPAHKFREKLIRMRAAKQSINNWAMLCSTLRIWGAFVEGETLDRIYFTDELPQVAGFNPERL